MGPAFTAHSTWARTSIRTRGGDRTFSVDGDGDRWDNNPEFLGSTLDVSPKNDVGFYGGIKLGYVFGTGVIRPTIEGDWFYNGFRGRG